MTMSINKGYGGYDMDYVYHEKGLPHIVRPQSSNMGLQLDNP